MGLKEIKVEEEVEGGNGGGEEEEVAIGEEEERIGEEDKGEMAMDERRGELSSGLVSPFLSPSFLNTRLNIETCSVSG